MDRRTWAVALLLLAASCSPTVDTNEPKSLRKTAFIRRADAICRQTRHDIHEIATPMNLRESIPARHKQIEEVQEQERMIRALPAPPDGRNLLERWLNLHDAWYSLELEFLEAAKANDSNAYHKVALRHNRLQRALDKAASAYGFKECGYISYLTPPPDDPEPTAIPGPG